MTSFVCCGAKPSADCLVSPAIKRSLIRRCHFSSAKSLLESSRRRRRRAVFTLAAVFFNSLCPPPALPPRVSSPRPSYLRTPARFYDGLYSIDVFDVDGRIRGPVTLMDASRLRGMSSGRLRLYCTLATVTARNHRVFFNVTRPLLTSISLKLIKV